jgi:hypothetical protein
MAAFSGNRHAQTAGRQGAAPDSARGASVRQERDKQNAVIERTGIVPRLRLTSSARIRVRLFANPEIASVEGSIWVVWADGWLFARVALLRSVRRHDEAHHCYREKPIDPDDEDLKGEEKTSRARKKEAEKKPLILWAF